MSELREKTVTYYMFLYFIIFFTQLALGFTCGRRQGMSEMKGEIVRFEALAEEMGKSVEYWKKSHTRITSLNFENIAKLTDAEAENDNLRSKIKEMQEFIDHIHLKTEEFADWIATPKVCEEPEVEPVAIRRPRPATAPVAEPVEA